MNTLTAPPLSLPQGAPAAARTVLSLLQRIRHGTLTLHLPNGDRCTCGTGDQPHATLVLKSWDVCAAALKSGDIGFAESYIAGDWSTPNLTTLLRVRATALEAEALDARQLVASDAARSQLYQALGVLP